MNRYELVTGSRRTAPTRTAVLPLAILRGGSVWRVIWLGWVSMATILWASQAFAQSPFPDGVRDPAEWYFCYSQQVNRDSESLSGIPWSALECEHLLWQESTGGGGIYESLEMYLVALAGGGDSGEQEHIRTIVLPPQGTQLIEYSCHGSAIVTSGDAGGTRGAGASSYDGTWFGHNNTRFSIAVNNPPFNETLTQSIDVVGTWNAEGNDKWWEEIPVAGSVSMAGWSINAVVASGIHLAGSDLRCVITGWEMWTGVDPWLPGEGDFEPDPVPTPWPGLGTIMPLQPITFAPVENDVNLVIGEPGTPECSTIVPGRTISQTVFGTLIDIGWSDYEICAQPTEFDMEFFGIDFGAYLLLGIGIMCIGVVFKFFRTG